MLKAPLLGCVVFAAASPAQVPAPFHPTTSDHWPFDRVLHDAPGGDSSWAMGSTWKARFDRDGFTFVPYLRGATHDHPMHFRIAALRVGGKSLPLANEVLPARSGDRVTFDRGALREQYDLSLQQVEQSFVIDTALPGDVVLELSLTTDLVEDVSRPGLQFGCTEGAVDYSDAFVVRGTQRLPIATAFANGTLQLHVPAALRGDGALVIDPILSSQTAATPNAISSPDVAYDATNARHLLVWELEWSEFDHDVLSLAFDANGNAITGSGAPIDASTDYWVHPRVGNRNLSDNFLVVASVLDAMNGNRMMVYGRTRSAGGAMAVSLPVLFSSPSQPGENFVPEVGSDPGTGSGNHDWLVVWATSLGSTQAEITGRLVDGAGQPRGGGAFPIQSSLVGHRHWNPHVSASNGEGSVAEPQWLVTWDKTFQGGNAEVLGRFLNPVGVVTPPYTFDVAANNGRQPCVSSPVDLGAAGTGYLVTWERATSSRGLFVRYLAGTLVSQPFDLTAQFTMGRFAPRVDSDGARFLVTASAVDSFSTLTDQTRAWTLAYDGVTLLAQEGPTTLPGVVSGTQVRATHATGGGAGDYAIAHLRLNGFAQQPVLTRYAGITAGAMTQVVPTACDGLQLTVSGSSALGASLDFALGNVGVDIPGLAFGSPAPTPIPVCPNCSVGLRLDLPILTTFVTSSQSIAIPPVAGLVGQSFAMQGLALGANTCFGMLRFSDTIVFTIR